jgi:hypothetical protein
MEQANAYGNDQGIGNAVQMQHFLCTKFTSVSIMLAFTLADEAAARAEVSSTTRETILLGTL